MILTLDTETTGVDVFNDRIVTLFLGLMDDTGSFVQEQHFLINPGVPIPAEAAAVHGISTELAVAQGVDPVTALELSRRIIEVEAGENGLPLVVYNASFDLSLLEAEFVRHGLEPLGFDNGRYKIIDPLILDKHLHRYRKGKGGRKLTAVAPIYGVPVEENAHDAAADCLMAGRIARKQLVELGKDPQALQSLQREWHREQALSLQQYFDKNNINETVNLEWPVRKAA